LKGILLFPVQNPGERRTYMPCPHCRITIVQRSENESAVSAAAYQSGDKLFSEYKDDFTIDEDGVPVYKLGLRMHHDGVGKAKHRVKYQCPYANRKMEYNKQTSVKNQINVKK